MKVTALDLEGQPVPSALLVCRPAPEVAATNTAATRSVFVQGVKRGGSGCCGSCEVACSRFEQQQKEREGREREEEEEAKKRIALGDSEEEGDTNEKGIVSMKLPFGLYEISVSVSNGAFLAYCFKFVVEILKSQCLSMFLI